MGGCIEGCSRRKSFDARALIGVQLDMGIHLGKKCCQLHQPVGKGLVPEGRVSDEQHDFFQEG